MIIGAIVDVSDTGSGPASNQLNGAALQSFYTMTDALTWARIQSGPFIAGSSSYAARCLCTVINTETEDTRWWYNGVEYTG